MSVFMDSMFIFFFLQAQNLPIQDIVALLVSLANLALWVFLASTCISENWMLTFDSIGIFIQND